MSSFCFVKTYTYSPPSHSKLNFKTAVTKSLIVNLLLVKHSVKNKMILTKKLIHFDLNNLLHRQESGKKEPFREIQ